MNMQLRERKTGILQKRKNVLKNKDINCENNREKTRTSINIEGKTKGKKEIAL